MEVDEKTRCLNVAQNGEGTPIDAPTSRAQNWDAESFGCVECALTFPRVQFPYGSSVFLSRAVSLIARAGKLFHAPVLTMREIS